MHRRPQGPRPQQQQHQGRMNHPRTPTHRPTAAASKPAATASPAGIIPGSPKPRHPPPQHSLPGAKPSYLGNLTRSAEGPPGRRGPSSVRRPLRSSTPRPVLPTRVPRTRFPERPDWPDPQSQSLSRSYGSRLPISLTYINLSTRGSEPRRPDAEMGTVCVETGPSPRMAAPPAAVKQPLSPHPRRETPRVTSSLTSFTDWRWCTGRHKNCVALRPPCGLYNHRPLLASDDFQGPRGLKQKRKLSPGPDTSGRKPDPVTRARHTYGPAPPVRASPSRSEHRSRNNYRVPFRHCILPRAFMSLILVVGSAGCS